jgi:2-keto-4-pentenoate hydratase/2-oxohepta-3-ene-1,7-dioic acid hydratase in catechol pathway
MKLCTFFAPSDASPDALHVGALTSHGVADLTALGYGDMRDVFASAPDALRRAVSSYGGECLDPQTLRYGNVSEPRKIICAGLNYRDHALETGGEPPHDPVLFTKFADTLAPHNAEVVLPQWLRCYDYEAELVVVIARDAYNIDAADADDYIFGYACGNDLSARDAQFLSAQWAAGKNLPGFAPVGPFVTTRDEWSPDDKRVQCFVNGNLCQDGNTRDMIFTAREYVAAASRYFRLSAGDLVFTGTPAGVILGKPKGARVWLRSGDTVRVAIEGLGALETRLV